MRRRSDPTNGDTEMTGDHKRSDGRRAGRPLEPRLTILSLLLWTVAVGACDSLNDILAVDLPGQVVDEDLDNPALAGTLVLAAQGEFECAFQGFLWVSNAAWAQEFYYTGQLIEPIRFEQRSDAAALHGSGNCTHAREPNWLPLQIARTRASDAIRRIQGFPEGSVPNVDFLIGKAFAYEGYATLLLGEAFCGVVFDGDGVVRTREDAWRTAVDRFTSAIEHSRRVTAGANAAEARSIVNLALVGRARARLNLGDGAGVTEDAMLVPDGFVYNATYDQAVSRRWNHVTYLEDNFTVHSSYRELTVDGVPDPRVPVEHIGETLIAGVEHWVQRKFPDVGADIPFATWREAQLMIAEVEGGQTAVDIINRLRSTYDLPRFSGTDPAAIRSQVLEERRRELWLQGTKIGDDLRTGRHQGWDTGLSPLGRPYSNGTCMPVPEVETL